MTAEVPQTNPAIELRTATAGDEPFLLSVYASTREEELAMVTDWSPEQKDAFVRQQFLAQHTHYHQHYPGARFDVIVADQQPAGRLYVHRRDREIRLMDIALLPPFRRRGVGGALLASLMDEARAAEKSLTIHVEKFNPAMRLYERLGFVPIAEHGAYDLMEWKAGPESDV